MKIGSKEIGYGHPSYLIVDLGSNHCGDLQTALDSIHEFAVAGVQSVKVQLFRVDSLYPKTGTADYLGTSKSLHEILKPFELPLEWLPILKRECDNHAIDFGASPFYLEAVDQLLPYVSYYKIASFENQWHELIRKCVETKKPVIISLGGTNWDELYSLINFLEEDANADLHNIAMLHCVSKYPVEEEYANIEIVQHMEEPLYHECGITIGYSDHTQHPFAAPCIAATCGALIIEKHATLSKAFPSPDAKFALEPYELKQMVEEVRRTERLLGNGARTMAPGELVGYKRAWYATREIATGERLTRNSVRSLRSTGVEKYFPASNDIEKYFGTRKILAGELITEDMVQLYEGR